MKTTQTALSFVTQKVGWRPKFLRTFLFFVIMTSLVSGCNKVSGNISSNGDNGSEIQSDRNELYRNDTFPYSEKAPEFPESIPDYVLADSYGYDYVRLFSESSWEVPIKELDPKRNGGASMSCQPFYWVIRWRSNNPDVIIKTAIGLTDYGKFDKLSSSKTPSGGAGYIEGSSCVVPGFRFDRAINGNRSNLVDLNFEYQIWEYKPKI